MLTQLCHNWNYFYPFWLWFGCDWLWLAEEFLQNWRWLHFAWLPLVFFAKQRVPSLPNIITVGFWSLKGIFSLWDLAPFTVEETGSFVAWKVNTFFVWACWSIHIYTKILNWFLRPLKNNNPSANLQERRIDLLFQGSIAHLTRWRAVRTLIVASVERLKNPFVHAKYIQTPCNWTIHAPNRLNNAIVIPRKRSECTTHRNCSQLVHTCLQRNIGSWRDAEFRDG